MNLEINDYGLIFYSDVLFKFFKNMIIKNPNFKRNLKTI
jgi:hypothetical protein